ncbi:hypothetical protein NHQ30_004046 [Ciborinia camelliae]|nr:hypothetical protein NHQ30_004046 [Ciborinia camelliae]
MFSNNSSSSSRYIPPYRTWGGLGDQGTQEIRRVVDQRQPDSTHITANGGDTSENTPSHAPANDPPAKTTTSRKGKGKNKWAKVDLADIAPMATSFDPPVQSKGKGNAQPPFRPRRHEGPHRGVNVDGESLDEIADRLKRFQLEEASKLLTEFPIFTDLAPEIRFNIWNLAARAESRILELVCTYDNHRVFEVSSQGQVVPGVMQANSESRRESKLVFEKRHINFYPRDREVPNHDVRPWTWYNPYNDIILFGEATCIRTVVDFFLCKAEEKYPKVAFRCGNMIGTCKNKCDFDTWEYPFGDDQYSCSIGAGIGGGGVGIMGVLHGKDEEIAMNKMVPGAPNVEEVFFVVKTECMKFNVGAMPSNLTFRRAIHNGLTPGQEKNRINLENNIQQVRSGQGVYGCGENRWDKGNYPEFSFMSLAPPLKNGRGKALKHDAIMVPTQDIGKLIYRNSEFLNDLGPKVKVDIIPSEKAYTGQKFREIGLYNGTEEGIEKAKEEIKKQLLIDFETVRRGPNHQGAGQARGGGGRGGHGGRGGRDGRGGRGVRGQ